MQLLEVSQTDLEAAIAWAKAEFDVCIKAEDRHQQRVSNERQFFWNKAMKSRATTQGRMEADRRGFDAVIGHLKDKHTKEMGQMRSAVDEMTTRMDGMRGVHIAELNVMKKKLDT